MYDPSARGPTEVSTGRRLTWTPGCTRRSFCRGHFGEHIYPAHRRLLPCTEESNKCEPPQHSFGYQSWARTFPVTAKIIAASSIFGGFSAPALCRKGDAGRLVSVCCSFILRTRRAYPSG